MARPTQNTIDYFSHDCNHKQTMYILENKYKNDGYAFWFKLLESLGSAPNHFLDLNDEIACEFLAAKTNLNWSSCDEILTLLAKINAICPELWSKKIVWCQNFVDRLSGVYAKRKKQIPNKPSFCDGNDSITVFSDTETPQSKVKESKVKESNNPTNFDNNGLPPEQDTEADTEAEKNAIPQKITNLLKPLNKISPSPLEIKNLVLAAKAGCTQDTVKNLLRRKPAITGFSHSWQVDELMAQLRIDKGDGDDIDAELERRYGKRSN
jgi:hypothetical protein